MKPYGVNELRRMYLNFFESKGGSGSAVGFRRCDDVVSGQWQETAGSKKQDE